MLFDKPVPFSKALEYRRAQKVLPLTVGSREISELAPELREQALFSARTTSMPYLAKMDQLLTEATSPSARAARGESAMDAATIRIELRKSLESEGYVPKKGEQGGLKDLSSDRRLNLIIDTNLKQTYGWAQHELQQDPDTIDSFPCLELVRIASRKVPRAWQQRWVAKGGKLYNGRMIARKDSDIWTEISRFALPYPPFDFNSGMGVEEVDRPTAESLGVIKRSTVVQSQSRPLASEYKPPMPQVSAALQSVIGKFIAFAASEELT